MGDRSKKQDRIMKIVQRQQDPMEPPKHKIKKIPRRPPSPPPPVMHSPTHLTSTRYQSTIPSMLTINMAAWLDGKGETLRLGPVDIPRPGPDELLVKNHAAAVNPVDWRIQDTGRLFKTFPVTLGSDVAGEVIEVGLHVTRFKKGDRVFAHQMGLHTHLPQNGGFLHYVCTPETTTAQIPSNISYTSATVLPLAIDTSATGLFAPSPHGLGLPYPTLWPPDLDPRPVLIIWGGSSSVGALAIQLAHLAGARVIATASPANFTFCKSCGANQVFDYRSASVVEDVFTAATISSSSQETIAGIYDAISTPDSYASTLAIASRLSSLSSSLSTSSSNPNTSPPTETKITIITVLPPPPADKVPPGVLPVRIHASDPITHPLWREFLTPALEKGLLKCLPEPLVIGKGLEYVQKGLDLSRRGVSARKVVVEIEHEE